LTRTEADLLQGTLDLLILKALTRRRAEIDTLTEAGSKQLAVGGESWVRVAIAKVGKAV
jgi:hypothetical protein